MNKILGMDSAYTSAVEHRGGNMIISASLVSEMVDRIRELEVTLQAYAKYENTKAMERDIRLLNEEEK